MLQQKIMYQFIISEKWRCHNWILLFVLPNCSNNLESCHVVFMAAQSLIKQKAIILMLP